jgi:hypothetical protein
MTLAERWSGLLTRVRLVDVARSVAPRRDMMPTMNERFEVQRTIPADAATIFRVVSDPQGHVAIDASGMLQSSSGEAAGAVGDTFVIHMDRESLGDRPMGKYDVTVTITGYEQDRFITWEVSGQNFPSIGHYYGYRLEPVSDGTLVTSIYDWSQVDEKWKPPGTWPIISEASLKATLGILERTVRAEP